MPKTPPIQVDLVRTRRRIKQLQRYVEGNLLRENKFLCHHCKACRLSRRPGDEFLEGTMSHVGHRFDLLLGDKPLRVVVVGQEAADRKVSMDERYRQVHDGSGLESRYYADPTHKARNPHMRGTTSALRLIFGGSPGADYDGEWVHPANGDPFHIFDGFALVNRLLCFAGPPGTRQGRASKTMLDNCEDHLTATLSILQPTILILQGGAAKAWSSTSLIGGRTFAGYPLLREAHLGGNRLVVCTFSHPSAQRELRWGDSLDRPYLTTVIEPTVREAIRQS